MKDNIVLQIPIQTYGTIATAAAINGVDVCQYVQATVRRHIAAQAVKKQSDAISEPEPAAVHNTPAGPKIKSAGLFDTLPTAD